MSYKVINKTFDAYDGSQLDYFIREDTNDLNTILSIVDDDEYHIKDMTYSPNDTFVDIGAHIGGWSKFMSALVSGCTVIAVEPLPDNLKLLEMNKVGAKIVPKAIFSRSGAHTKIYYGDNTKSGRHHRFIGNVLLLDSVREEYIKAETISLNDLLKDTERVRVMKMDCEGGEYAALAFASKATLSKIDYIIGEYHNLKNEEKKTRTALLKYMKGLFTDISESQEDASLGQFWFRNKRL